MMPPKRSHARQRKSHAWTVAAALCALALWPQAAMARQVSVSAADLLDYYALGQREAVAQAVASASDGDLGSILTVLEREAAAWLDEDGPAGVARRQRALTLFCLEVAHAGLETQWARSAALIEWAARHWPVTGPASDFERRWHVAALALIEGARDIEALRIHLARMERRIPDEPRIRLARAFIVETEFWDDVMFAGGMPDGRAAASALVPLANDPMLAREVALRRAYFALHAKQPADVLTLLPDAAAADDAGQRYLVELFRGLALRQLDRSADAAAAFRHALVAVPRARAASMHLATLLAAPAESTELRAVLDAAVAPPVVLDPWTLYGYGDFRRLPALLAELRRMR